MTSYLLLLTFLINEIQARKHRWRKHVNSKEEYVEKKEHVVRFHKIILDSLGTFQLTLLKEPSSNLAFLGITLELMRLIQAQILFFPCSNGEK